MKKIYLSLATIALSGGLFAQSTANVTQYDFAASSKHAGEITTIDMRAALVGADRVAYYTENFDAMTALDGVGTNWLEETGSGPVDFELTSVGHANDASSTFVIPVLATSTPTQWILLDSDSDGSSGDTEQCTLTSPSIDISGTAGTVPLKLEFDQFFAEWETSPSFDTLYVGISDDDGVTWNDIQISNGVGRDARPNPETMAININPYVTAPYDQLKIRFIWDASWAYGVQIDNVNIAELPDNDLKITSVFRGDIANDYMYSMVPLAQAAEFVIGADIQNIGFADQTNVVFDWEIFDPSMTSLGTGTSTALASLANAENDTIWVSTGITPATLGSYTIEFSAKSEDFTDDEPANNDMTDTDFEITTSIYGSDYGTPTSSFYNWAGNTVENGLASIGNIFTIVADGVIGAVDSELNDNVNVVDQVIIHYLYKWDGAAFVLETESDEYTTVAADEGEIVRIVLDDQIDVVAGDIVLVCAGHLGGDPSAGWELSGKVGTGTVRGTLDDGSFVSLINPTAPVVRAVMIDFTGEEEIEKLEQFSVYPNPAEDVLVVDLTLLKSENTMVNVLDLTGKVIETISLGSVNGEAKVNIDLGTYTSGVYFIEMTNEGGKQVKKFVKK